jgi:hypothetical protein
MKIRLLAGAVAAGLMTLASSAYAVPIAAGSTLSLQGQDTYTATSITFVNPANVGNGTGSFASLAPFPCNGCATMTNFTSTTAPGFQL